MFSKEYFLYLLKSKKYLLILIALVSLLNVLGNQMTEVMLLLQAFFSIVLSFVIPLDVFYHVHLEGFFELALELADVKAAFRRH